MYFPVERVRGAERAAARGGRQGVREPAQRRRGFAASEGPEGDRLEAAAPVGALVRRRRGHLVRLAPRLPRLGGEGRAAGRADHRGAATRSMASRRSCEHWEANRHSVDWEIDGTVIKVDQTDLQRELGATSHAPRWAIAYKFPPEERTALLKKIDVHTGRTGKVTPFAVLDPCSSGGVTITYATLHNEDEVRRKDVRQGDTVIVRRAGDVIPEIVGPVLSKRKKGARRWKMPTTCSVVRHAARAARGRGRLPVPEQAGVSVAGHRVAVPLRRSRRDGHRAPRLHDRDAPARSRADRGPCRHLRARRRQALAAARVQGQGDHERADAGRGVEGPSDLAVARGAQHPPRRLARRAGARARVRLDSTRSRPRARTRSTPCPRSVRRSRRPCASGSTRTRTSR